MFGRRESELFKAQTLRADNAGRRLRSGADAGRRNTMRPTRSLAVAAFGLALATAACGGSEPGPVAPVAPAAVLPIPGPQATTPATVAPPITAAATAPATTPATTRATTPATAPATTRATAAPAASVYYANCTAVRAAGAAPIRRGQPGYAAHLDRDNDGIGCE